VKQVHGPLWFVPSSTKEGGYLVNVEAGRCQCPDHTGQGVKCKHLHAVELVRDGQAAQVALTLPASPAKARPMPRGDLTAEEIACVRAAMRFLAKRAGGWEPLAKAIRAKAGNLMRQTKQRTPTAGLAVRLARFAGVPVDDLLAGRFPPSGACPHCGHTPPTALPAQ
jgi:hypothetical protein